MKHPTNKQERRDIERRKLENLYNSGVNEGYPTAVTFLILDEECGEDMYNTYYDCYGCSYRCIYDRNKNQYITWEKPTGTNYTLIRDYSSKHSGQTSCTSYYKRYSSKILRKKKELYQHNQYRRVFDYKYTLW